MDFLAKHDISRTHFVALLAAFGLSIMGSASLVSLLQPIWQEKVGSYGVGVYGANRF